MNLNKYRNFIPPIFLSTGVGIFYNSLSILFSVLQISIMLQYLGKENYGIWITIYSFCNWMAFLDGGLGNGVRNLLTNSIIEQDIKKSRQIISTGYISIFLFLIFIYLLVIVSQIFVDWNAIIGNNYINYNTFALFIFGSFLLQMVQKLISKIYFAYEKASLSFLTPTVSNFVILILLCILLYFNVEDKMWNVGIVFSIAPLVVFLIFTIHFFTVMQPDLKPSFRFYNPSMVKTILSQGLGFFLIQMSAGVLQAIAPIFVTLWFSVELTADYQISMRYYSVVIVILNIVLQTLWTPITKSFILNQNQQLLKFIKIKILISFGFLLLLLLMWLGSNFVYEIWLGKNFVINNHLDTICVLFVGSLVLSKSFTNFLNAIGKIKVQSIISIGIIVLYVPLIYVAVKVLNLGLAGLILFPTLFFVVQTIISAYELKYILKK